MYIRLCRTHESFPREHACVYKMVTSSRNAGRPWASSAWDVMRRELQLDGLCLNTDKRWLCWDFKTWGHIHTHTTHFILMEYLILLIKFTFLNYIHHSHTLIRKKKIINSNIIFHRFKTHPKYTIQTSFHIQ